MIKKGEETQKMNERIKQLRTAVGLNQRDFSQRAKIGHSTLAMFETGQRIPKDIHIAQICQTFNVNEEWLRNGTGEMFVESDSTIISQLSNEYGLDAFEKALIEGFIKMSPEQRAILKEWVKSAINETSNNEQTHKGSRIEDRTSTHVKTSEKQQATSDKEPEKKATDTVRVFQVAKDGGPMGYTEIPRETLEKLRNAPDVDEL